MGWLVRSGRDKDLKIVVLRQLTVLRRQIGRLALTEPNRSLLGAIAAALPRARRAGWLVTPDTRLRWHRRRIARHWTPPTGPPGAHQSPPVSGVWPCGRNPYDGISGDAQGHRHPIHGVMNAARKVVFSRTLKTAG